MRLWVHRDDILRESGEFLWEDLRGMRVVLDNGRVLGEVFALQDHGAQDILLVRSEKGEWMIPFIEDVVQEVDEQKRHILIHLLEGMEACFTPKS